MFDKKYILSGGMTLERSACSHVGYGLALRSE
jgi:hypothetical protein